MDSLSNWNEEINITEPVPNHQGTIRGTLMKCDAYRPPAWIFGTLTQLALRRTAPERARAIDDPIRLI